MVAAGLIPPTYMMLDNDDDLEFRAQLERQGGALFEMKRGYDYDPSANIPGEFSPYLDKLEEEVYPQLGLKKKEKKGDTDTDQGKEDSREQESPPQKKGS